MTAVEWLVEQLNFEQLDYYKNLINQAKEIEKQQQDEFAIGFVEWIHKNDYCIAFYFKQDTTKELLEIYKTEKGL
jgi:hypothetical protein